MRGGWRDTPPRNFSQDYGVFAVLYAYIRQYRWFSATMAQNIITTLPTLPLDKDIGVIPYYLTYYVYIYIYLIIIYIVCSR